MMVRPRDGAGIDPALARLWVGRFERQQRRYGPPIAELAPLVADLLGPTVAAGDGWLLDVGCGTGSVGRRLARSFSGVRVTGVDHDPLLLALARAVGGLEPVDADLGRVGWAAAAGIPPGALDGAVAWSVVHMLAPDALVRLYQALARLIRPGGCLVIAERIPEPDSSIGARLACIRDAWLASAIRPTDDTWASWWADAAREPRFAGLMEVRDRRFPDPSADPPPVSVEGHLDHLRAGGFPVAGVVWSRGDDRLLVGWRPETPPWNRSCHGSPEPT
jgi:SAM-dependent methyltransferase